MVEYPGDLPPAAGGVSRELTEEVFRLLIRNDTAFLHAPGGLVHSAAPPKNGTEPEHESRIQTRDETIFGSSSGVAQVSPHDAHGAVESPEAQSSPAPAQTAKEPARPASPTLIMDHDVQLETPSVPVTVDPAATYRERFLKLLPAGPTREAWSKAWTYNDKYSQNQVDLPFPYPADKQGHIDQNNVDVVVRGLHALGAGHEARGVLENWLSLGERYTSLPGSNQLNELGRSGMPTLSRLLLEQAKHDPDPKFLPRSYRVIADDYRSSWSDRYFKAAAGNGLDRFCDVDYSSDASLQESGGEKNRARFKGDPAPYNPVDLNANLYRTEKDLGAMAARMADRTTGKQAATWRKTAADWKKKATQRKETMLERLWDPEAGLFTDLDYKTNQRSKVPCLATYAVLDNGVLDPSVPQEKKYLDTMVGSLDKFFDKPDQKLPVWDTVSKKPADPADVLMVARGLRRYGYDDKAQKLEDGVRSYLADKPIGREPRELAVRAVLDGQHKSEGATGLQDWVSPGGLQRLRLLYAHIGGKGSPRLEADQAGQIDRHLCSLHPSLLAPAIVKDLHKRGLDGLVYGVKFEGDQGKVAGPGVGLSTTNETGTFDVGPVKVDLGIKGSEQESPGEGAFRFTRNGASLNFIYSKGHLVVGDRAYAVKDLGDPPKLTLPRDILSSFWTAGGNPQLESFYDRNRDWIHVDKGPASTVQDLPGRGGWRGLFDRVGENWKALTIDPSVVSHDTAVQFFNPAAVPSTGLFKTQFNWDTMFMAKGMQLQGQDSLVAGMTDNLLYILKTVGRVPNAARSVYLNKSQPPFLPSLVRMSEPIRERQFGDKATTRWVKEAYDLMSKDFQDFWHEPGGRGVDEINGDKVCLSRYGGPNDKFAMDESGYDTTSRFAGKTKDLIPPDLNAYLWGYSKDMEAISLRLRDKAQTSGSAREVLKYSSQAAYWSSMAQKIKRDVIKYCWDSKDGMFRDYRFQGPGQGLQRGEDSLSAAAAPLWVGMLDPKIPEEKEMIDRSLDAIGRFEKPHGLAATAEDYGHPEMQWNGPSGWSPLHMMAVEAEVRYGRYEAATRHTSKWLDTVDKLFNRDGVILERYDVVKGDYPPVQKGRYEETQGAGPGFGWTNSSVPWALVEVVGGVRLHRDPALPTVMNVIPHIPAPLEGKNVTMTFSDPGSGGSWKVTHNYSQKANHYSVSLDGNFSDIPVVNMVTPPLDPGTVPKAAPGTPPFTIKQEKAEGGKVRYRLMFESLKGQHDLHVDFDRASAS